MKIKPDWLFAGRARRYSAIGLSFLEDAVNLVQLDCRGSVPAVSAASLIAIDGSVDELLESPEQLKSLLQPALKQSFVGRRVYSCLPAEHYRLLYINYRQPKSGNEATAVLEQVRERLDGPVSGYVIDYLPIRAKAASDENLALVSVSSKPVVEDYLDCLQRSGLYVDALEIAPVSINRLLGTVAAADDHHNSASLTVGRYKSTLSVYSGRRLILDREVQVGERDIIQQLCRSLDVDEGLARRMLKQGEAGAGQPGSSELPSTVGQIVKPLLLKLAHEFDKAQAYTASQTRGEPIRHIYLLGAASDWPLASRILTEIIDVPVSSLSPVTRCAELESHLQVPQALADHCLPVSCGLALRGALA